MMNSPMCDTSNRPHRSRTALCSTVMPGGILDGHLVSGERDDLRAERDVLVVEGGTLERARGVGAGGAEVMDMGRI